MDTDKPDQVIDLWPNMIMLYPLRTLSQIAINAPFRHYQNPGCLPTMRPARASSPCDKLDGP